MCRRGGGLLESCPPRLCPHPVPAKGGCVLQSAAPHHRHSSSTSFHLLSVPRPALPAQSCRAVVLPTQPDSSTISPPEPRDGAGVSTIVFVPLLVTVGPVRAESPKGSRARLRHKTGWFIALVVTHSALNFSTNATAKRETRRVSFLLGCACVAKFFLQLQLRTGKIKIKPVFTDRKEDPVHCICIQRPPFHHSQLLLHGFGQPAKSGSSYGRKHVTIPHKPDGIGPAQRFLSRRTNVDFGDFQLTDCQVRLAVKKCTYCCEICDCFPEGHP